MKYILLALFVLSFNAIAYDARITDKYGRTTGYIKGNEITDKYGKTEKYIKGDEIKSKHWKTKGYIKIKDKR